MQRVEMVGGVDGTVRCDQSLSQHLTAEYVFGFLVLAPVKVLFDLLDVE
jgi:hypothetical protein